MLNHVRFRKSFESYAQGQMYKLPEDLAALYIKAGVAELVDYVPKVVEPEPVIQPSESVTDDADDGAEPVAAPKRKRT